MKKHIISFTVLFQLSLYACATCMLMVPSAEVKLHMLTDERKLNMIHAEWNFSNQYTSELISQYDKNANKRLDKNELDVILKAKLDYLIPKDMLTRIKYGDDKNEFSITPKYDNFGLKVIEKQLLFFYDLILDIDIKDKSVLSFSFEDDEGFFNFVVTDVDVKSKELYFEPNLYLHTTAVLFSYTKPREKETSQKIQKKEETKKATANQTQKSEDELSQENLLKKSIAKIKDLFESIKDSNEPYTYIVLLFFAYLYGVIHAMGPGHGKALVSSYFLSNDRSYSKALSISFGIGLVHTFSAFLLTLIIYFIVNTFLARVLDDTVFYTTKLSAVIIISIALYLIYKKYKAYKALEKVKYSFSTTPHISTCSCSSCKMENNSTDTALIISAGIIPCPGTITIFIFSLSLGLYYIGFLSAFVMSLGMSTVIFFSAVLSAAIRKKTSTSDKLKKYLEYLSLTIILILGIILLLQ